ncbi:MAG: ribonuclease III [Chloroflexi bacterium]|nr:MAG: ribonuclease III [Chloroflexota bacterium]
MVVADIVSLQETLRVVFNDPSWLEQALIHRSYLNEHPDLAGGSNERLEFLGDAILGYVMAEKLFHDFPELAEGEMTRLRSAMVSRETLARVAGSIGLGEYLYLGKGEEASGGRHKPANLASALEAVVAAVFLDQGHFIARELVMRLFAEEFQKVAEQATIIDYKSRLQELVQAKYHLAPTYRVVEVTGPDHDRRFTVEVLVGDKVLGRGSGRSKKLAETEAARAALEPLATGFTP